MVDQSQAQYGDTPASVAKGKQPHCGSEIKQRQLLNSNYSAKETRSTEVQPESIEAAWVLRVGVRPHLPLRGLVTFPRAQLEVFLAFQGNYDGRLKPPGLLTKYYYPQKWFAKGRK